MTDVEDIELSPQAADLLKLDDQIKTSRDETQRLIQLRDSIVKGATDDFKTIAEMLHSHECKYEHTEACGWFYENDWDKRPEPTAGMRTWTGWAHKRWLEEAIRRVQKSGVKSTEYIGSLKVVYAITGEGED